jgi:hypothetical protein
MSAPPPTPAHLAWYETERRFTALAAVLAKAMGPGCYWSARADISIWRARYGDEQAYLLIAQQVLALQMTP